MTRKILLSLIVLATPALGGCGVQAALAAAELAPRIRGRLGPSNAHLEPAALQACTQRAGQYGSVFIVDVEQRGADPSSFGDRSPTPSSTGARSNAISPPPLLASSWVRSCDGLMSAMGGKQT